MSVENTVELPIKLPRELETEKGNEIIEGEPRAEILGGVSEFSNKRVSWESRRYARI